MERSWALGHSDHAQAMQVQSVAMSGCDPTHRAIQGPFTSCRSTKALSWHTGDQTKSSTSDLSDPENSQGMVLASGHRTLCSIDHGSLLRALGGWMLPTFATHSHSYIECNTKCEGRVSSFQAFW